LKLYWERKVPEPVARAPEGSVRLLEWTGYGLADGINPYTPAMAAELGLDRFEHKLHPHGARYVEIDDFAPQAPYEDRDQIAGFLSRLGEEKGIRTLADVARRLPYEVRLRFGGGDLEHWLREALDADIQTGDVDVAGWGDHADVPAELNRMRLLVMPSQPTEGLPTVILEVLACGTPVFASPVSGVPDVVCDDETGFLMEDVDIDAITGDVEAILAREDLPQISRNGRELIESEYSFEAAGDRYRHNLAATTAED